MPITGPHLTRTPTQDSDDVWGEKSIGEHRVIIDHHYLNGANSCKL